MNARESKASQLKGAGQSLALILLVTACGDDVSRTPAVGTLERDRIDLIAESNDPIVERRLAEGARVEAGEVILRIDDTRLRAQLAQVAGQLEQARARLAELERGPRNEEIAAARARLAGAQSALATAIAELERSRALFAQDVRSRAQLDAAQERHAEALARRDEARSKLEALVEGTTAEELEQARGAVAATEGLARETELRVDRLTVRAPVAGIVDALPFELGERPPVGAVVVVMLAGGAPYARVYVPQPLRALLGDGARARVRVPGLEREYAGRLRTIARDPVFTPYFALTQHDRSRLAYVSKVDLDDPEARDLPAGLPVEVRFDLEARAGDVP
jgi:HlyD family secretion protein